MASTWIVVPCFNEAKRLDLSAFIAFVHGSANVRLLFVDDGSTDGTGRVLERLRAERPEQIELLALSPNRGKGEAVRAGMLRAIAMGAAYAGYWDADLSTPLDTASRFIRILDDTPWLELVMGSRVQLLGHRIERRALRHYVGRGFATAASLTVGLGVYDTQCGAKLFRVTPGVAAAFAHPFVSRWAFDVELLARIARQRKGTSLPPAEEVIREEPLAEWRDVGGSKLTTRDWLWTGFDLLRIAHMVSRSPRAARAGAGAAASADAAPGRSEEHASELWPPELYRLHADAERVHWWFRARRRILTRIAQRILGDTGATIVDVGCGTGGNIGALAASYSCIGIDPAANAIDLARERHPNVAFIAGAAPRDLPARGRDADLFILADVLEHVDDDRGLLGAIVEASKPGAHVVITVPAQPSLWSVHDVTLGHRRRYDAAMLSALWARLPVTVRLLSAFNARLFPAVKIARTLGRLRGSSIGAAGTDITVPPGPLNVGLERMFAGECTRLIAALDGRRTAYRRGSSLLAVLRRDEIPGSCITSLQYRAPAALHGAPTQHVAGP